MSERELCSACGGNGVLNIPGGVAECRRCDGIGWELPQSSKETPAAMPYYEQSGVTIYHGDCREVLPTLRLVQSVVIADPPYDAQTHAGARSLGLESRKRASDGRRGIAAVGTIEIDFAPADVEFTASLWKYAARWCLVFCSLEMLGEYRRLSGDAWVRGGVWHRPDGAPQITGDRPGQPGEGIAILHQPGRKRWNGGGHHAFYEHCVVKHDRLHPTQKPESLMRELVALYSEPDETVLDPFMGSGTTLVAAKRLGRKAIGIELEERYCEIAARRLQQDALPLEFCEETTAGSPQEQETDPS